MKKRKRYPRLRQMPATPARAFIKRARRELNAAPAHLNPAIALYIKLKPQIQTLSLLDLQLFAPDMEQAARAGEHEAQIVQELVRALEVLAPEASPFTVVGF